MPIEIRELVIRARVEEKTPQTASGGSGGSASPSRGMNAADMQRIVAMCAEEVIKALKQQKER
ncbi:DUF5908 family protein [Chitinophaga sp. GCM10012297]|uniref:Uncharacterized protein n=1 Tax=Chitinophaga chungangae TaxID=2821488 RepID=A0ABS3Y847_9BACT|nr:DUF5908 family protein [Chitinophaga chungangae]MBO9150670.1 hypothetical protein [Chitinophaga chungangae]